MAHGSTGHFLIFRTFKFQRGFFFSCIKRQKGFFQHHCSWNLWFWFFFFSPDALDESDEFRDSEVFQLHCNWYPLVIFFSGALGDKEEENKDDGEGGEDPEIEEARREAEEKRKEKHRKMEEERETMRQSIRDKVIDHPCIP